MIVHIENREKILQQLKEELVGPSPFGEEIDCSKDINFTEYPQSLRPHRQKGSGQEILQRDPPVKRYGIGVLYPLKSTSDVEDTDPVFYTESTRARIQEENKEDTPDIATDDRNGGSDAHPETRTEDSFDDLDLSMANSYRPSSIAISFLAEIPEGSRLLVSASGGRYRKKTVQVQDRERDWWLRSSVSMKAEYTSMELCSQSEIRIKPASIKTENTDGLDISIEVFSRPFNSDKSVRLITVCLVNRYETNVMANEFCLFQSAFQVILNSDDGQPHFLPYPSNPGRELDDEEQSLTLLYSGSETFAVGHGCAADWEFIPGSKEKAVKLISDCFPSYETPSITAEICSKDGSVIQVPMAPLAGLVPGDNGMESLSDVVSLYGEWIADRKIEARGLSSRYSHAAEMHLREAAKCFDRMQEGLKYLSENPVALRAFQLANHAILLQQVQYRRSPREFEVDPAQNKLTFFESYKEADPLSPPSRRGNWYAFQIAFLLMTLKSTVENSSPDHLTTELLWFPTGGGKTEAYLGLAAFYMFHRRLMNLKNNGVNVIMRYTLRLLTTQQFQRAAGLICAMEYIRRQNREELGENEFSIGVWLGGDTTPNNHEAAVDNLKNLYKGDKYTENLFLLNRCPWCGARMGPVKYSVKVPKAAPKVMGYEQEGKRVVFKCTDRNNCLFGKGLPVYVVDEDIYEKRPTLLIGTVDKFAILPWRPEARAIFGIEADGSRICSPPGLIIQDELHLISGPLGSLVGMYETLIEELCTDRRPETPVQPKIISSTATIRRYKEQLKALYGRESVTLFPPPGLDINDSFFARYARKPDGSLERGKIYVGVHAPGLGSIQTAQVRTMAALLQAPVEFPAEERDPWWTLVSFFNSLRELGTTLTLFQADIPTHLDVLKRRYGLGYSEIRHLYGNPMELTSRKRNDEIPEAIAALEVTCTDGKQMPVDACLASNIIEVGIDIDRLSMMVVVGQPKTTSQYIQVTGRVGRMWQERPGLIVTIYSASKPRDRSHFEKFRSYHERLYAQVEPTSLTPFSPPVLDRALHAVMVAYVRVTGDESISRSPYPYPDRLVEQFYDLLSSRIRLIDGEELSYAESVFREKAREWQKWQRTRWSSFRDDTDAPLLRQSGRYVNPSWEDISWPVPSSMRNVDAECEMQITYLYLNEEGDNA